MSRISGAYSIWGKPATKHEYSMTIHHNTCVAELRIPISNLKEPLDNFSVLLNIQVKNLLRAQASASPHWFRYSTGQHFSHTCLGDEPRSNLALSMFVCNASDKKIEANICLLCCLRLCAGHCGEHVFESVVLGVYTRFLRKTIESSCDKFRDGHFDDSGVQGLANQPTTCL